MSRDAEVIAEEVRGVARFSRRRLLGWTGAGVAAGALIGNRLSNFLEGDEQTAAAQAAARAAELPTGQKVTWKNTDALSQTAGSGDTVAIVDVGDDPTAESDLAAYRSNFRLPACTTKNTARTRNTAISKIPRMVPNRVEARTPK